MFAVAIQDVAIALADKAGTLRVREFATRFGDTAFAIEDERGIIEVALTRDEAYGRLAEVTERLDLP